MRVEAQDIDADGLPLLRPDAADTIERIDQTTALALDQGFLHLQDLEAVPMAWSGLIQSLSQALLPGLSAWAEVGGIAPSLCLKALPLQSIST
jgi:hypothetical protein